LGITMSSSRNCGTSKGAHDFAPHLLTKAAERLRRGDYLFLPAGRASFLDRRSRRLVG